MRISDWSSDVCSSDLDVSVDITPREYVLDYLQHSFPVQLYEPCEDNEGSLSSRPVRDDDGNPVINREAVRRRDAMIERLAALPPVPGALDQIIQHFGPDAVAEVTGRSRRIVPRRNADGSVRFAVENRPASANLAETHAFMDDVKRILIFSEAGGTGRSYHADLGAKNRSEEQTSELQSLMRIPYAVFCLTKKKTEQS